MNKSAFRKQIMIIAAVLAVVLVVVFSSLVIIEAFDHDCSGEHCPVCAMVSLCGNTLKEISAGNISVASVTVVLSCLIYISGAAVSSFSSETPVTRKVRIND